MSQKAFQFVKKKLELLLRSIWEAFRGVQRLGAAFVCLRRPSTGYHEALPVCRKLRRASQEHEGGLLRHKLTLDVASMCLEGLVEASMRQFQFAEKPEVPLGSFWDIV